MNKTYILDTNVLLSDSNALFSFKDNNIVLPFIVIEELDRHKDRQDEVGKNARETARKLSILTKENKNLSKGVSLGERMGTLRVLSLFEAAKGNIIENPVELDTLKSGDNIIVKFCLNYITSNPEEKVILITRDVLLQLKCQTLNVDVEDYKKFNVVSSAETLYSGMLTLDNIDVSQYYKDKESFRLPEEITNGLFPNQFLVLRDSPNDNATSALVRYFDKNKPLKQIHKTNLGKLSPRNKEQECAVELLMDPNVKLVSIVGLAGSGKTLTALAAGLEQIAGNGNKAKGIYKSLVVCRPIQPFGKDVGYLPGSLEEKMAPWLAPVRDNLRFLITEGKGGKHNEQILQDYFDQGIIEMEALTFIRGRSIADAFMLIDEAQNLTAHEMKTILTRVGENTKIVLTGDINQIDNLYIDSVSNGLSIAVEKFKDYAISGHVLMTRGERSELATLAARILA